MADYGIKVSKTGNDVKTATDDDIILTSKRNCLKVDDVFTDTISTDGFAVGSKTVTHNLGFVPVVILILNFHGSYYFVPCETLGPNSWDVRPYTTMYITSTQFVITLSGEYVHYPEDADETFNFYYYLSETESAT